MRELTKKEQARLLTQEQVDALPEGSRIMVKWNGGNGPHEYIVRKREGESYACMTANEEIRSDFRLFPVGTERCHDRVFLPANEKLTQDARP